MAKDLIGYEALTETALRGVIREALRSVQKRGLLGSHHFYLSFKTHDPGVDIPDFLKERYPDEMTIVLQNQFSGLNVTENAFEVTLSFQKFPSTLFIPFTALTAFADPSVQFGLQFKNASPPSAAAPMKEVPKEKEPSQLISAPAKQTSRAETPPDGAPQIVSLDKFRKK